MIPGESATLTLKTPDGSLVKFPVNIIGCEMTTTPETTSVSLDTQVPLIQVAEILHKSPWQPKVGCSVGWVVGNKVGISVGSNVGDWVGSVVGDWVGNWVGDWVGCFVGDLVGDFVGDFVGCFVGDFVGVGPNSG